jgi:putative iron-only hydrogenase system regulator
MEKRLGAVAIVVTDSACVPALNTILSEHADIIIGRMGIPRHERGIQLISLMVEGDTDDIGSLTGKIGRLRGIEAKSVLTRYREDGHEHSDNDIH